MKTLFSVRNTTDISYFLQRPYIVLLWKMNASSPDLYGWYYRTSGYLRSLSLENLRNDGAISKPVWVEKPELLFSQEYYLHKKHRRTMFPDSSRTSETKFASQIFAFNKRLAIATICLIHFSSHPATRNNDIHVNRTHQPGYYLSHQPLPNVASNLPTCSYQISGAQSKWKKNFVTQSTRCLTASNH
jgi:hypothetical protein